MRSRLSVSGTISGNRPHDLAAPISGQQANGNGPHDLAGSGNRSYSRRGASVCPARCLSRPARSSRSCAACGASRGRAVMLLKVKR